MEFPDTDVGLLNFVKFLSMARDEANSSSVVLEPIVQVEDCNIPVASSLSFGEWRGRSGI